MVTISNFTSYVPPLPLVPPHPNFAFCHPAYGAGLTRGEGMYAGGILPQGQMPIPYGVTRSDEGGSMSSYTLPFDISFAGVALKVEVAGPVDIHGIFLVPDSIRGMAGYLANHCLGSRGVGGFVTARIQGLVDYIGDPASDLNALEYPPNTAFLTLTMASPQHIHSFPGDNDPYMAQFLQKVATDAMRNQEPEIAMIFADRTFRYAVQAQRMSRLGTVAWWDDTPLGGNYTESLRGSLHGPIANVTVLQMGTPRRRKTAKRLLQGD